MRFIRIMIPIAWWAYSEQKVFIFLHPLYLVISHFFFIRSLLLLSSSTTPQWFFNGAKRIKWRKNKKAISHRARKGKNFYTWKRSEFKKSKNFNSFSMFNWFLQTFSIRRKGARTHAVTPSRTYSRFIDRYGSRRHNFPVAKRRFFFLLSHLTHSNPLHFTHSHTASPFSAFSSSCFFFTPLSNVLRIWLLIAFYFHALNIISCVPRVEKKI